MAGGAETDDGKRLPDYIGYIERQKERHAAGNVYAILERTSGEGPRLLREDSPVYSAGDDAEWLKELAVLQTPFQPAFSRRCSVGRALHARPGRR